jgi:ribonuclease P protein component
LNLKNFKITKRSEYLGLFVNADKVISKCFVVLHKTPELCEFRYGITASKKVGNAVKRNKCKRIVRVLMREVCMKPIAKSVNINVIVRKSMIGKNFSSIKADFTSSLKKILSSEKRDIKVN